ncbi:MAG TPA: response regulator transcription factor [Terracidiphilus sp.]|jgi:DNA-binding NarL/FixJ family response regulator|nr:response regulator transcription factor [Terracidiphilus sp.]
MNTIAEKPATTLKKTVLIVDDHPLMRQGLSLLINQQQDMQVCAEAEEAQAAMQAIAQKKPDILILDISLNGPDGLELLKTIRASDPGLPVLILSMHDEAIYAERALRARANGYIMKHEATEKVLVALRRILNGEVYLSDRMSNKMLQQFIGGTPSLIQSRISSLSDRELEVFCRIGEGRATREIAEELHLSIKTVETYQAHIKEKLALRSGRELIQHAIQWKINEKTA